MTYRINTIKILLSSNTSNPSLNQILNLAILNAILNQKFSYQNAEKQDFILKDYTLKITNFDCGLTSFLTGTT